MVSATQSCDRGQPPELLTLQSRLGGNITESKRKNSKWRREWRLVVGARSHVERALKIVKKYGIIKKIQAHVALDYLDSGKVDAEKAILRLSEAKKNYSSVSIDRIAITPAYMAGLFAAEGTVALLFTGRSYSLRAAIRQNGCQPLLGEIKENLGYGCLSKEGKIQFSGTSAISFLGLISPHMLRCQKRKQVRLALQYVKELRPMQRHGTPLSKELKAKIDKIARKIAKLKRI